MKTMGSGEQANGCAQEFLGLWEKVWSRLESGGLRQEQDGASLARPTIEKSETAGGSSHVRLSGGSC